MRQLSRHLMKLSIALSVWGAALSVHAQATPGATAPEQATAPAAQPARDAAPDLKVKSARTKTEPYVDTETEVRRLPNRPLLTTGSVLFIGSYVPSVIIAAASDDVSDNLYYPVAGPWMEIADEDPDTAGKTGLAIDGVFQGLSALMILGSFVIPERQTQNWYLLGSERFQLSPKASRSSYGLMASGRF